MFCVTETWQREFPGAAVGVLALQNVTNPSGHPELEQRCLALEQELRLRYKDLERTTIKALPAIQAYNAYYKRFKKSYHVQLQLESVVWQDKPIPRAGALVQAMFMAELEDLLLTAGHDLDVLELPAALDVAVGDEAYTLMRGQEQILKAGDMYIRDGQGVISSIIYGPDSRTRIWAATQNVMYTVYAPPGISAAAVDEHLTRIQGYALAAAPQGTVTLKQVF